MTRGEELIDEQWAILAPLIPKPPRCYDNATAESFFSRYKAELLEDRIFESLEQARSEIFSYIEGYYNRVRRHSALGFKVRRSSSRKLTIKRKGQTVRVFRAEILDHLILRYPCEHSQYDKQRMDQLGL